MLTGAEARRYQAWRQNGKRLKKILTELHALSAQAAALLLAQEHGPSPSRPAARRATKSKTPAV